MSISIEPTRPMAQPTPPASTPVSVKDQVRARSNYPPGIEAIIGRSSAGSRNRPKKLNVGPDDGSLRHPSRIRPVTPPDSNDTSPETTQVPSSPHSIHEGATSPQQSVLASDRAKNNAVVGAARSIKDAAIHTVRDTRQTLMRTCIDMRETLAKYFAHKLKLRFIELPAFRPLCKAFDRFIATLVYLELSIGMGGFYQDESDLAFMMYQIRSSFDTLVGESGLILKRWTTREQGRTQGEKLTASDRRLCRLTIVGSNNQICNLRKMVIVAEDRILQEQALRQPMPTRRRPGGKGWGWLKYLRTVYGPVSDAEL